MQKTPKRGAVQYFAMVIANRSIKYGSHRHLRARDGAAAAFNVASNLQIDTVHYSS